MGSSSSSSDTQSDFVVDPNDWANFQKDKASQPFASQIQAAAGQKMYTSPLAPQGTQALGGYIVSSDLANAYAQWQAAQSNQSTLWNQYANLANNQQGRDATVLTGSDVSQYQSLLGAAPGAIPNAKAVQR